MALSVIYDTSVILAQMTPVPQDDSIIWRWMVDGLVEPVVSDYLVDELRRNLALPRFGLERAAQARILAEYLRHALVVDNIPPSGVECRDPKDVPVLDLAIWAGVDALVTLDPDLLALDGEFDFRIVRPSGMHQMLEDGA